MGLAPPPVASIGSTARMAAATSGRELLIVAHRFQSFFISLHTDVAQASLRLPAQDAVGHSQPGGGWSEGDAVGQHFAGRPWLRRPVSRRPMVRHFVDHQRGDFIQQVAELAIVRRVMRSSVSLVWTTG